MTSTTTLSKHFFAELLFSDTDSLTNEITSEDVYEEFYKDKHFFDLSNYPTDSKFFDPVNENVIGKMKYGHKGKPIRKLVGLKSKMHCILSDDGKEANIAKGVNIATVNDCLNFRRQVKEDVVFFES